MLYNNNYKGGIAMLECIGLKKTYNEKYVMNDLSFNVNKGEVFAFLGNNGAGKTTTIKMILGLVKKDGGEIKHDDNILIGYSPETPYFPPFLTGYEVLDYYARKIKKPLDEIVSGMEDLRAGNSSARVNIRTEAEFERIVDTFNHMAEELERENSEKEELTRKKDQMLLELSHDIKTPVATIKSYSNALEAGLVPDEKKQEIYRIIEAKADRVHMLSEDMFTMLKMDNTQYNIELQKVNLCEYLRLLCAEYYDEITGADFEFDILIPDDEITALIDPHLFSRIISNLLSNAVKYNKTGSVISMELFNENGTVAITVSDDGEAIDRELSDKLFDACH